MKKILKNTRTGFKGMLAIMLTFVMIFSSALIAEAAVPFASTDNVYYVNNTDPRIVFNDISAWNYHQYAVGQYGIDFVGGDVHWSDTVGSYIEFTFVGYGIDFIAHRNSHHGAVLIELNGVSHGVSLLAVDFPVAHYVHIQAPHFGTHTIRVTVVENAVTGGTVVAFDAFRYFGIEYQVGQDLPLADIPALQADTDATLINDNHSSIVYSGTWTPWAPSQGSYQDDIHFSNVPGNFAELTFRGTGIMFLSTLDDNRGMADIYLNNVWQSRVDLFHPSHMGASRIAFENNNLALGQHTIRIVVLGYSSRLATDSHVAIDAFVVMGAESVPDGTINNPYLISNSDDLINVSNNLSAHYRVVADIDMRGVRTEAIGVMTDIFTGTLDGDGHTISNLTVPLFSRTDGAEIRNLNLTSVNVRIPSGQGFVGGLVGRKIGGIVENVTVSGAVRGTGEMGGLIGRMTSGAVIMDSHAAVTVTGERATPTIESLYIGGLVGLASHGGSIMRSSATGNVTGGGIVGGLVGSLSCWISMGDTPFTISESFATGNVTATSQYAQQVAGLVGHIGWGNATIINSFATGNVTNTSVLRPLTTSGLVGGTNPTTQIINSFSTGRVRVGESNSTRPFIGLVNTWFDRLTVNDLVPVDSIVTNSFFDSTIAGVTTPENLARTTTQMRQRSTFVDWDFDDIWDIVEGQSYPFLRNNSGN